LVPHFTSPVAMAAVAHCLLSHPGSVMNEAYRTALPPYLKEGVSFSNGRMSISDAPGLGVVFDASKARQIAEFTQARPPELYQGESIQRPDGSHLYL
jgi:L-alanine-DL-glutamate epimerase-like enolase superfamily enzyme